MTRASRSCKGHYLGCLASDGRVSWTRPRRPGLAARACCAMGSCCQAALREPSMCCWTARAAGRATPAMAPQRAPEPLRRLPTAWRTSPVGSWCWSWAWAADVLHCSSSSAVRRSSASNLPTSGTGLQWPRSSGSRTGVPSSLRSQEGHPRLCGSAASEGPRQPSARSGWATSSMRSRARRWRRPPWCCCRFACLNLRGPGCAACSCTPRLVAEY
mmetsp:Transcript_79699/g.245888  ORF Transcript_79699/g.245888 Transcript_79699/m.245888 type:complete len:215 (-) Transcript_79699:45-689(-)